MFGKRLSDERRRLGKSQDDFAKAIEIGRSGYAAIEGERAPLDVSRLVMLGQKAGVDVMYVLSGERKAVAAGHLLDWTLIEDILVGMDTWAVGHDIKIPPTKQMLLVKFLYEKLAAKGHADNQSLEELFRLVA
ncbi:helix-turn-helix domain-containing protein [Aquabacterium sp.]|uniref:helix-turn-helix domain-containing protein n=1 Tax=Aquabacterium sp. TaxID=1872578 RepID=UPI003BAEA2D6